MKKLLEKLGVHSKDDAIRLFWQFFKFGLVGLSNTAVSLAIYYLFIYFDKNLYMVGNIVGFIVGVANSFYWNRKFVFNDSQESALRALLKSYVAYGGSFLLGTALLALQVEVLHVPQVIAPLINLVITIPLNFLISKFWTFKR